MSLIDMGRRYLFFKRTTAVTLVAAMVVTTPGLTAWAQDEKIVSPPVSRQTRPDGYLTFTGPQPTRTYDTSLLGTATKNALKGVQTTLNLGNQLNGLDRIGQLTDPRQRDLALADISAKFGHPGIQSTLYGDGLPAGGVAIGNTIPGGVDRRIVNTALRQLGPTPDQLNAADPYQHEGGQSPTGSFSSESGVGRVPYGGPDAPFEGDQDPYGDGSYQTQPGGVRYVRTTVPGGARQVTLNNKDLQLPGGQSPTRFVNDLLVGENTVNAKGEKQHRPGINESLQEQADTAKQYYLNLGVAKQELEDQIGSTRLNIKVLSDQHAKNIERIAELSKEIDDLETGRTFGDHFFPGFRIQQRVMELNQKREQNKRIEQELEGNPAAANPSERKGLYRLLGDPNEPFLAQHGEKPASDSLLARYDESVKGFDKTNKFLDAIRADPALKDIVNTTTLDVKDADGTLKASNVPLDQAIADQVALHRKQHDFSSLQGRDENDDPLGHAKMGVAIGAGIGLILLAATLPLSLPLTAYAAVTTAPAVIGGLIGFIKDAREHGYDENEKTIQEDRGAYSIPSFNQFFKEHEDKMKQLDRARKAVDQFVLKSYGEDGRGQAFQYMKALAESRQAAMTAAAGLEKLRKAIAALATDPQGHAKLKELINEMAAHSGSPLLAKVIPGMDIISAVKLLSYSTAVGAANVYAHQVAPFKTFLTEFYTLDHQRRVAENDVQEMKMAIYDQARAGSPEALSFARQYLQVFNHDTGDLLPGDTAAQRDIILHNIKSEGHVGNGYSDFTNRLHNTYAAGMRAATMFSDSVSAAERPDGGGGFWSGVNFTFEAAKAAGASLFNIILDAPKVWLGQAFMSLGDLAGLAGENTLSTWLKATGAVNQGNSLLFQYFGHNGLEQIKKVFGLTDDQFLYQHTMDGGYSLDTGNGTLDQLLTDGRRYKMAENGSFMSTAADVANGLTILEAAKYLGAEGFHDLYSGGEALLKGIGKITGAVAAIGAEAFTNMAFLGGVNGLIGLLPAKTFLGAVFKEVASTVAFRLPTAQFVLNLYDDVIKFGQGVHERAEAQTAEAQRNAEEKEGSAFTDFVGTIVGASWLASNIYAYRQARMYRGEDGSAPTILDMARVYSSTFVQDLLPQMGKETVKWTLQMGSGAIFGTFGAIGSTLYAERVAGDYMNGASRTVTEDVTLSGQEAARNSTRFVEGDNEAPAVPKGPNLWQKILGARTLTDIDIRSIRSGLQAVYGAVSTGKQSVDDSNGVTQENFDRATQVIRDAKPQLSEEDPNKIRVPGFEAPFQRGENPVVDAAMDAVLASGNRSDGGEVRTASDETAPPAKEARINPQEMDIQRGERQAAYDDAVAALASAEDTAAAREQVDQARSALLSHHNEAYNRALMDNNEVAARRARQDYAKLQVERLADQRAQLHENDDAPAGQAPSASLVSVAQLNHDIAKWKLLAARSATPAEAGRTAEEQARVVESLEHGVRGAEIRLQLLNETRQTTARQEADQSHIAQVTQTLDTLEGELNRASTQHANASNNPHYGVEAAQREAQARVQMVHEELGKIESGDPASLLDARGRNGRASEIALEMRDGTATLPEARTADETAVRGRIERARTQLESESNREAARTAAAEARMSVRHLQATDHEIKADMELSPTEQGLRVAANRERLDRAGAEQERQTRLAQTHDLHLQMTDAQIREQGAGENAEAAQRLADHLEATEKAEAARNGPGEIRVAAMRKVYETEIKNIKEGNRPASDTELRARVIREERLLQAQKDFHDRVVDAAQARSAWQQERAESEKPPTKDEIDAKDHEYEQAVEPARRQFETAMNQIRALEVTTRGLDADDLLADITRTRTNIELQAADGKWQLGMTAEAAHEDIQAALEDLHASAAQAAARTAKAEQRMAEFNAGVRSETREELPLLLRGLMKLMERYPKLRVLAPLAALFVGAPAMQQHADAQETVVAAATVRVPAAELTADLGVRTGSRSVEEARQRAAETANRAQEAKLARYDRKIAELKKVIKETRWNDFETLAKARRELRLQEAERRLEWLKLQEVSVHSREYYEAELDVKRQRLLNEKGVYDYTLPGKTWRLIRHPLQTVREWREGRDFGKLARYDVATQGNANDVFKGLSPKVVGEGKELRTLFDQDNALVNLRWSKFEVDGKKLFKVEIQMTDAGRRLEQTDYGAFLKLGNQIVHVNEALRLIEEAVGDKTITRDQVEYLLQAVGLPRTFIAALTGGGKTKILTPGMAFLLREMYGKDVIKKVTVSLGDDSARGQAFEAVREVYDKLGMKAVELTEEDLRDNPDALKKITEADVVYVTRHVMQMLESAHSTRGETQGLESAILSELRDGLIIGDEAHQLNVVDLINGKTAVPIQQADFEMHNALLRVDKVLERMRSKTPLNQRDFYLDLFEKHIKGNEGEFSTQFIAEFAREAAELGVRSAEDLLRPRTQDMKYLSAALGAFAEAIHAKDGQDNGYGVDLDNHGARVLVMSFGQKNDGMRWGQAQMAGARQIVGARILIGGDAEIKIGETVVKMKEASAAQLLELAETNGEATRVSDSSYLKRFKFVVLLTATPNSVIARQAISLGLWVRPDFQSFKPLDKYREGGANAIRSGRYRSFGDVDAYMDYIVGETREHRWNIAAIESQNIRRSQAETLIQKFMESPRSERIGRRLVFWQEGNKVRVYENGWDSPADVVDSRQLPDIFISKSAQNALLKFRTMDENGNRIAELENGDQVLIVLDRAGGTGTDMQISFIDAASARDVARAALEEGGRVSQREMDNIRLDPGTARYFHEDGTVKDAVGLRARIRELNAAETLARLLKDEVVDPVKLKEFLSSIRYLFKGKTEAAARDALKEIKDILESGQFDFSNGLRDLHPEIRRAFLEKMTPLANEVFDAAFSEYEVERAAHFITGVDSSDMGHSNDEDMGQFGGRQRGRGFNGRFGYSKQTWVVYNEKGEEKSSQDLIKGAEEAGALYVKQMRYRGHVTDLTEIMYSTLDTMMRNAREAQARAHNEIIQQGRVSPRVLNELLQAQINLVTMQDELESLSNRTSLSPEQERQRAELKGKIRGAQRAFEMARQSMQARVGKEALDVLLQANREVFEAEAARRDFEKKEDLHAALGKRQKINADVALKQDVERLQRQLLEATENRMKYFGEANRRLVQARKKNQVKLAFKGVTRYYMRDTPLDEVSIRTRQQIFGVKGGEGIGALGQDFNEYVDHLGLHAEEDYQFETGAPVQTVVALAQTQIQRVQERLATTGETVSGADLIEVYTAAVRGAPKAAGAPDVKAILALAALEHPTPGNIRQVLIQTAAPGMTFPAPSAPTRGVIPPKWTAAGRTFRGDFLDQWEARKDKNIVKRSLGSLAVAVALSRNKVTPAQRTLYIAQLDAAYPGTIDPSVIRAAAHDQLNILLPATLTPAQSQIIADQATAEITDPTERESRKQEILSFHDDLRHIAELTPERPRWSKPWTGFRRGDGFALTSSRKPGQPDVLDLSGHSDDAGIEAARIIEMSKLSGVPVVVIAEGGTDLHTALVAAAEDASGRGRITVLTPEEARARRKELNLPRAGLLAKARAAWNAGTGTQTDRLSRTEFVAAQKEFEEAGTGVKALQEKGKGIRKGTEEEAQYNSKLKLAQARLEEARQNLLDHLEKMRAAARRMEPALAHGLLPIHIDGEVTPEMAAIIRDKTRQLITGLAQAKDENEAYAAAMAYSQPVSSQLVIPLGAKAHVAADQTVTFGNYRLPANVRELRLHLALQAVHQALAHDAAGRPREGVEMEVAERAYERLVESAKTKPFTNVADVRQRFIAALSYALPMNAEEAAQPTGTVWNGRHLTRVAAAADITAAVEKALSSRALQSAFANHLQITEAAREGKLGQQGTMIVLFDKNTVPTPAERLFVEAAFRQALRAARQPPRPVHAVTEAEYAKYLEDTETQSAQAVTDLDTTLPVLLESPRPAFAGREVVVGAASAVVVLGATALSMAGLISGLVSGGLILAAFMIPAILLRPKTPPGEKPQLNMSAFMKTLQPPHLVVAPGKQFLYLGGAGFLFASIAALSVGAPLGMALAAAGSTVISQMILIKSLGTLMDFALGYSKYKQENTDQPNLKPAVTRVAEKPAAAPVSSVAVEEAAPTAETVRPAPRSIPLRQLSPVLASVMGLGVILAALSIGAKAATPAAMIGPVLVGILGLVAFGSMLVPSSTAGRETGGNHLTQELALKRSA